MEWILASASPRRRELLEHLGIAELHVIPAEGEERAPAGLSPAELVRHLAYCKAEEVAERLGAGADRLIIAADTVVVLDGQVLGKPRDAEDAVRMLSKLSGRAHKVYTGLAVFRGNKKLQGTECSSVHFRALDAREIEAYVATGEPLDKAGAYGIQGRASLFVTGIEGDYFNVVGLPLCRLGLMLREVDVVLL